MADDHHADSTTDPRRAVPRADAVLADPRLVDLADRLGRTRVKQAVSDALDRVRSGILAADDAADEAVRLLPGRSYSAEAVINATGVVLHTNLGRAPLSPTAREAIAQSTGYVDVEFDLSSGRRSARGSALLDALRRAVPAAQDVMVVNNGAAALVLATTLLGAGRQIIVSRGEMVEIGDGFRLPELIESTGAKLREVGTTNRVRLDDYAGAIGAHTAAILKVHPSNFRIEGFTSSVSVGDLSGLGVPIIADIGSGLLTPHPLLPDEPDAATALADGASIVTCSGDKLLGGPQAGLLLGRADLVARLRRHPLTRALRVDKLTIAALEATLNEPVSPTWQALTADADALHARARAVADAVGTEIADVVESDGAVGGGGAPGQVLHGWAVALDHDLAARLRSGEPPVVGRVEHDKLLLDLRCVEPSDDEIVVRAIRMATSG